MEGPLVTVIIPTYNRAEKVVNAIESVNRQTYKSIQLIVVDDGSVDHTAELLRHREDLLYVYQGNEGQASARSTGLLHAKGDLVASLDSDDYWEPLFLEKCVAALLRTNSDFVFANWNQKSAYHEEGWQDFLTSDPYLRPFRKNEVEGWFTIEGAALRQLYLVACPSPSSSTLLRRSSIATPWNENLNIGDDWGLYLDMILTRPCKVAFTMERLWYKDVDGQNIFDGRKRAEVVKLLLIEDTQEIMNRYSDYLSSSERKILERRYVEGVVEFSKHILVRDRDVQYAYHTFKEALSIDAPYSLITAVKLLGAAFSHRFNSLRDRLGMRQRQLMESSVS